MTFGSDRSVSVHASWVSPADPDVPVHHYKLSWSLTLDERGYTTQSKLKKRRTISGVIPTHLPSVLIFCSSSSLFPKTRCKSIPPTWSQTTHNRVPPPPFFSFLFNEPQQMKYNSAKRRKINNSWVCLWSCKALNWMPGWYHIASSPLAKGRTSRVCPAHGQKQHINSHCIWEWEIS